MRSAAAAFAWEFRHRHRWYLLVLPAYLFALGLVKPLFLGDQSVRFDPPDGFAAFGVVPFTVTFFYLIGVFTFGLTGDLAARQSIFPARLFTLPASTAALAGWPMLYGCLAMLVLWATALLLGRLSWGVELPWLWPGLLAAVVLAWIQFFTWMPYGLRGLRVAAAVLVLMTLDFIVFAAIEFGWSETALAALLAPQLPLAYLSAWWAVARARRGEVPDWSWSRVRHGGTAPALAPFRSMASAQLWFEWRRHGRALPVLVAIVVPFELSVLFIAGYGSPSFVAKVLIAVLLTPILMAAFAAATVSMANPFAREVYGISPFAAAKPITTAQMIAAKLKMASLSTMAAWLFVLMALVIGFTWSGADSVVIGWQDWLIDHVGVPRALMAGALVLGGLMSLTWTMLVQGLYIGLTGRQWLVRTIGLATLVMVMVLGPAFEWFIDNVDAQVWLYDWWRAILAVLVVVKTSIATWITVRLSRRNVVPDRVLAAAAASWTAAVLIVAGAIVWWLDSRLLPRYVPAMFAVLAVPVVRVAAAPLALDWNRHR